MVALSNECPKIPSKEQDVDRWLASVGILEVTSVDNVGASACTIMVDRQTVVEDLAKPVVLGGGGRLVLQLSPEGGVATPARAVALDLLLDDESFMVAAGAGVIRGIVAAKSGRSRRNWG